MPAVIKTTMFQNPITLIKGVLGLNLINDTRPKPDTTMVNSAKNRPSNMAAGMLASLPHSKVTAANAKLRPSTVNTEGRNKI